jgi:hypothetical protein
VITEQDLGLSQNKDVSKKIYSPEKDIGKMDITGDQAFLELMRQNKFEVNLTAKELNSSRGTVASRFKGITLQFLAEEKFSIEEASKKIAGKNGDTQQVERKLESYYTNLKNICEGFDNEEAALKECLKRLKNVPQSYHPAVKKIVARHFDR